MDSPVSGSFSLKWHKALTWVLLFLNALYFVWSGVVLLLDAAFDLSGMVDRFSAGPGAGRILFLVFGLLFIALAVLSIHTRFQLARFEPNGPRCLSVLLLACAVVELIFPLLFSLVADGAVHLSLRPFLSFAAGIALLVLNRMYYQKRADLFRAEEEE